MNVPSVLGALRMSGKPILVEPQGEARFEICCMPLLGLWSFR